jgi:glycosyltransferase involved in cell wall biosynthesis
MRQYLSDHKVDLIHYDTIALARFLEYAPRMPSVVTHHNIESELMRRRALVERWPARSYLSLQARKLRDYEARMSARFDVNVMVSDVDERMLKCVAPGVNTVVVPNGVDIDYFQPGTVEEEAALVYAGGMNMFANRDAVLHFIDCIWPRVKAERPDVRFDIIGQDPPVELLERAHSDSGLHVHGYVDDVRPYIQRAAVSIIPIRVGGGTRLKVLDALASGKAIVSTAVGCEGIKVSNGIDILMEDDPERFASQVVELLNDHKRRKALGAEARRLAESEYAWGPISARLEMAYAQALSRHEGTSASTL